MSWHKAPRFKVGDKVVVVGLPDNPHHAEQGIVTEITGAPIDAVPRYVVTLANGASNTFFAFELIPEDE